MSSQAAINYQRISKAIGYITDNFQSQPSLDDIANHIHLSPTHFQKLFTDWAGVSPKKFLQYISVQHAKQILKKDQLSLFETTHETGLSSTSRLHDLFITIEGMTPAEYKQGGKNLNINYSFAESHFGKLILASTSKGICSIAFVEDEQKGLEQMMAKFPNSNFQNQPDEMHQQATAFFQSDWTQFKPLKLHLKGSDFQLKVWECLLKIPMGDLSTYGNIAAQIDNPKASRAVGTAIGSNPIAYLIPCHRVIQASGVFGGYMWGPNRKTAIIGWENAKINSNK